MRSTLACCVLIVCTLTYGATTSPAPLGVSGLRADPEKVDIGTNPLGKVVDVSWRLVNESGSPVMIRGIRTSCTCTKASVSANDVAPGAAVTVQAQVSSDLREGDFLGSVMVLTDENGGAVKRLLITGRFEAQEHGLAAYPEKVMLGEPVQGSLIERVLRVTRRGRVDVGACTVSASSPDVVAAIDHKRSRPDAMFVSVLVRVPPKGTEVRQSITVSGTDPNDSVTIPVEGLVRPLAEAEPPSVLASGADGTWYRIAIKAGRHSLLLKGWHFQGEGFAPLTQQDFRWEGNVVQVRPRRIASHTGLARGILTLRWQEPPEETVIHILGPPVWHGDLVHTTTAPAGVSLQRAAAGAGKAALEMAGMISEYILRKQTLKRPAIPERRPDRS